MKLRQSFRRRLSARTQLIRLVNGTAWSAGAGILNQGGTLVTNVIVARALGLTEFGQYAAVLSVLMSVAGLAQTGLGVSAAKHIAEFRSVDKERTGRIMGVCAVVCPALAALFALAIACSAPLTARWVLGSESLATPLAAGTIYVLFSAVNGYQTAALTGLERYSALIAPAALSTVITIIGAAVGAFTGGVTGSIAGLSLATAVRCCLHGRVVTREARQLGIVISWRDSWRELPILYHFGIPSTLIGYLMVPALWFANGLLVRQPGGYGHMAQYAAAQAARQMVMFIPQLLNLVGLAMLNNVRRGSNAGAYESVRRMNSIALIATTAVNAVVAAAFGKSILGIFGKQFDSSAGPVLMILLISAVLESAMLGYFQAVQSAGRMWTALVTIGIPWQAAFAWTAWLLVPGYGAAGLAAASLVGSAVALVATVLTAVSIRGAVNGETTSKQSFVQKDQVMASESFGNRNYEDHQVTV